MKDLKFRFFIHHVFPHSEGFEEQQNSQLDEDSDEDDDGNSSHVGLVTVLILLSIGVLFGSVFFLMKQCRLRKTLLGESRLSESYDILTTSA